MMVMVARLLQALEREQARRRVVVLAALDTPRYQRLLRELDARIQHPPLVTEDFALRDVAAAAFARLRRAVEDRRRRRAPRRCTPCGWR
jgi:hypothetical protein